MLKVMLVDDIEIMRKQIKRLSIWKENSDFVIVSEAGDGQEALEKLQAEPVELLITDISMPVVNGIELLREVKEKSLASCVVFLTEHSEFSFAKEAIKHGVFDYLVKPVNEEELKELLKKVKKYIEEKNAGVKNLVYSESKLESIVKAISEGDAALRENIEVVIKNTFAASNEDVKAAALVLQKIYGEIYMRVKANNKWLDKLIDEKELSDISLTRCDSLDLINTKLIERIELLVSVINKFILSSKKSPLIKEICTYIINNMEKEINMTRISEALFLTKNHIGDIFKQETGMTVGEYITMIKMERAKLLLTKEDLKSYEAAHKLCYNNAEYFAKLFKKHTGLSPMEFKYSTQQ